MAVLGIPGHVEAIVRVAMTSIQRNPRLLDCDRRSLMCSIMQSCQLGLEPDDVRGLAYLVPFKDHGVLKCQLIPGYRGLQLLGLQTEGVHDIYSRLVHAKDQFEYRRASASRCRSATS
jgi:recombination protein RecT